MRRGCVALVAMLACAGAIAQEDAGSDGASAVAAPLVADAPAPASTGPAVGAPRTGRDIYRRFREGLAEPECTGSSDRWRRHYAAAPRRLAHGGDDVLPLFGYVVDALREAHLPTEYALIPFVESGYKPGARSRSGPAGMWQFIGITARKHQVPMRAGYDGRLSPIDSTRAAVRYLKTLHGMFAGDWRLAVMAYNAGEYRIFGALRRAGQEARSATPEKLPGLSGITHAYVRKLRALSCLMADAGEDGAWLAAMDRPVPPLEDVVLPPGATRLEAWAAAEGLDARRVRRLNPAFANGRIPRGDRAMRVLVPAAVSARAEGVPTAVVGIDSAPIPGTAAAAPTTASVAAVPEAVTAAVPTPPEGAGAPPPRRSHTVARGDSAWKIARRYGVPIADLLTRNGLDARGILRPGMVLAIDADPGE
jgi:membrane-bound lytic murein transglycosylase D